MLAEDKARELAAWLIRKSGPQAGTRHLVRSPVTTVGRSPENDVVEESLIVSGRHLEIRCEGQAYQLYDLNSSNGTYVDGRRVERATLQAPCSIRLGSEGPELGFVLEPAPASTGANRTLISSPGSIALKRNSSESAIDREQEELLSVAVERARALRRSGVGNQTIDIMREVLGTAIHRTSRKFKTVILVLVVALAGVTGYGFWRIDALKKEKRGIDARIQDVEALLEKSDENVTQADQLVDQLDRYQHEARALQNNLFYRVGVREQEEPGKPEIRALMAEFGAETYSIPPEFQEQVKRFIERYQGPDRSHMERVLGQARKQLETMRRTFEEENLPPDLAYMVLVESAMSGGETSAAGAAGLWQFTPATAKAYGLKVTKELDERLDPRKATRAACKYIRELILDFGSGSSVMLALAAYNLGPSRVKQAVRNVVADPIKQRNFWYLYRVRALPPETREYVPKVIAAMIIGRNPERFGFSDRAG